MWKNWLLLFGVMSVVMILPGCNANVDVNLNSAPAQVAELIGGGEFLIGDEVTVSALPQPGWEFVNWTSGKKVVAETSEYTFVIGKKTTLTANFQAQEYAVSALAQGQGSFLYPENSPRHGVAYAITARPERGYRFVCWLEDGEVVSNVAEYAFIPAGDRELTAMFLPEEYRVELTVDGGGQVVESWTPDALVTLAAIPQAGYEFFGWVDLVSQQEVSGKEEYSFVCQETRNMLARFRKELVPADGSSLSAVVGKATSIGKYAPQDLVTLPRNLSAKQRRVRTHVADALELMAQAALADGVKLNVDSAYRSYNTQYDLFHRYAKRDGVLTAETYSARPGQSEHQLGTAVDFGGTNSDYDDAFAETNQGKWLLANAYKYGFCLSYPKGAQDITGYKYEPWHYRFIGVDLALEWKESGLTLIEILHQKDQAD